AARIGPTVWELDGPTPMEKKSKAETYAVTPPGYVAAAVPGRGSRPQDARHLLALGQFVDELVHVPDLLHERVFDRFHAHAAHDPGDQRCVGVEVGRGEEVTQTHLVCDVPLQRLVVEAGQPAQHLVEL